MKTYNHDPNYFMRILCDEDDNVYLLIREYGGGAVEIGVDGKPHYKIITLLATIDGDGRRKEVTSDYVETYTCK